MRKICSLAIFFPLLAFAVPPKTVTIRNARMTLSLEYGNRACITSMIVNGQKVISATDGAFTSVKVGGYDYSSLNLLGEPRLVQTKYSTELDGIVYGDGRLTVREKWVFKSSGQAMTWHIERTLSRPVRIDESESPVFNFDQVSTWDGAYQGYGGLAWFYLFNERLCTYGTHTNASSFWSSKTGVGLDIQVESPGRKVAMKYSRTAEDHLSFGVTVSGQDMLPRYDSATHRRRFIRGRTDVWAPFDEATEPVSENIVLNYFDVNERYGRGRFAGVDGSQVSGVLNTIARIGVIDSLHFGGNSWHTPYGPICLHEQYIAQMGLAIDDPHYLRGYESCLDFYRDHAIKPDGRVFARWAYSDEDMMPGQGNKYGFYEAQWGMLMDANPDFVTNVAELYDLTGNLSWVKQHQLSCEKVLDWILKRDSNGNGLVEMETDSEGQRQGSDWIDIIWASYENAFVNAKLYHALVKWAAIERQLYNEASATRYEECAARLKASFNKSTKRGGFWDEERNCYVHWLDKDGSAHGRNLVTPVNFMAIAYGICDDPGRAKRILDSIEAQMQREKLFFWPLCMSSYAPGEGKDWQFPFPSYENGDLFLSWGSVAVAAYAQYRPDVAVRYVKNVLARYANDGLAFQRYGRRKQEGLGDDILSGNCLSIVGLYQAIYGINPLYNRLYLNPHITPELAGTALRYNFRGDRLTISLNTRDYAVSDSLFRIRSSQAFGFSHFGDSLLYFAGEDAYPSFQARTKNSLSISIQQWDRVSKSWTQEAPGPVNYSFQALVPGAAYSLSIDGKPKPALQSDLQGKIQLQVVKGRRVDLRLIE